MCLGNNVTNAKAARQLFAKIHINEACYSTIGFNTITYSAVIETYNQNPTLTLERISPSSRSLTGKGWDAICFHLEKVDHIITGPYCITQMQNIRDIG